MVIFFSYLNIYFCFKDLASLHLENVIIDAKLIENIDRKNIPIFNLFSLSNLTMNVI